MRRALIALAALAFSASPAGLLAQDAPLPEVRRAPITPASSPADCNEPITPKVRQPVSIPILVTEEEREPVARPRPREAAPDEPEVRPAELPPRPSGMTAAEAMAAVRQAARTGTYEDFARALDLARGKVAAMPAGNERRAFTEALDAYSDIEEIWKYAVTDPMGAFYNEETLPGVHARLARKYPRYEAFIREQAITDSAGNRLYPTTETRAFLADQAESRMRGIRLPEPGVVAEREARPVPEVRPEPERPRPRVAEAPRVTRRPEEPRRPVTRPRAEPSVPAEPAPEEPAEITPPEAATTPAVAATQVTEAPRPVTVPPVVETQPRPVAVPELEPERRALSGNTLLLISFGLIALAAVALMIRAFRTRPAPAPIISPERKEPLSEPKPGDTDWIDPESRHWIEDVNKPEKPPN